MASVQGLPRLQQSPCHHCLASRLRSRPNGIARRRRQTAVAAGGSADEERDIGAQWSEFVASAKKSMPEVHTRLRSSPLNTVRRYASRPCDHSSCSTGPLCSRPSPLCYTAHDSSVQTGSMFRRDGSRSDRAVAAQVESRERAGARWNDSRAPNWARESFRQQADSRRQSIEKQEMQLLDFWNQVSF